MFTKGIKLVAGLLVGAVLVTTVPAEVFTATEQNTYMWDMSVGFTAGAHHAMEDTVVLTDTELEYIASTIFNGEVPLVAKPEEVNPYANMAVAKVEEYVNIRTEADENAEALGKLYANGVATVLEALDGWYKVTSGNVTGYVNAEYLVVGDEATCVAAEKRVATVTTPERLNLRREANTSSSVLISLPSGAKATVVDESIEGWIGVQYNGKTGYISAQYATVETTYSYAESKEEEAARLAAEEAARQAAEAARLAAEEAARVEANRKQQYINAANKTYYPPSGTGGQAVVNYAMQFVGNPYVLGGSSLTSGIDCSNFVMRIYEAFGVTLPHTSWELRNVGYEVSASEIKPGDIICYQGHVSIYAGNGQCVHAANSKAGIKVSPKWNYTHVITIRRIFDN
ncbi:MAG: SH3 domain-containing protein [Agathobacter sp.]|nr:SH3 domain-containing protein [Agathobacter sp.]